LFISSFKYITYCKNKNKTKLNIPQNQYSFLFFCNDDDADEDSLILVCDWAKNFAENIELSCLQIEILSNNQN